MKRRDMLYKWLFFTGIFIVAVSFILHFYKPYVFTLSVIFLVLCFKILFISNKPLKVPVIMFHSVTDNQNIMYWPELSLDIKTFEAIAKLLSKYNYNTIFLDDLYSWKLRRKNLPQKTIALTFDDGYLDFWLNVFPILDKYRLKATLFVTKDFIDPIEKVRAKNYFDIGYLNWAELEIINDSGLVDIQPHGSTHTWYFCNNKIIDFYDGSKYPWMQWNSCPNRKPYWLTEWPICHVPYGYPVFEYGKSLQIRRYFENKDIAKEFIKIAQEIIDDEPEWKNILFEKYKDYLKKHTYCDGAFESDKEYKERLTDELTGTKNLIEKKLGKKADILCWPGGGKSEESIKLAYSVGYKMITGFNNLKNTINEDVGKIGRIDGGIYYFIKNFSGWNKVIFFLNIEIFRGIYIYYPLAVLIKLISQTIKKRLCDN